MSHSLALILTAGIGAFLLATHHAAMPLTPSASRAIEVALEPEPAPPAPPVPPVPEPPQVARPLVHREAHPPAPAALMAASVSMADFSPAQDSQSSPIVEVPTPVRAPSGTIDAQYAATLHSNIDSRTESPKSAEYRLLRPHGEVRVNFTLERSGLMVSSELARSSGSKLLDHHALEIVREGHYPPFPDAAFPGESSHSFLITLEFHS